MCGVETLRVISVAKSNTILKPNCTLQEAGITGDCVLIVEAAEFENAPLNAFEYVETTTSIVSILIALSMYYVILLVVIEKTI